MLPCVGTAGLLSFDLSYCYQPIPPVGDAPWLNATFDDTGQPADTVVLTLTEVNLTLSESVKGWYFNLDPDLDPCALGLSDPCKTGSFADPIITCGTDEFQADGDGELDFLVTFSNADGPPVRFGLGDAVEYTITYSGPGSLTADSFNFVSAKDGGQGEYLTAAHIISIGPDSGWITVPEPTTVLLLALGLGISRRRRRA